MSHDLLQLSIYLTQNYIRQSLVYHIGQLLWNAWQEALIIASQLLANQSVTFCVIFRGIPPQTWQSKMAYDVKTKEEAKMMEA